MLYNTKLLNYIDKLFPITLLSGFFITLILQCIFYNFFDNKMHAFLIIYMLIFCIIDVIIGIKFIFIFSQNRKDRPFIYKSMIVVGIFILLYLYSMFKYKQWSNSDYNNFMEMFSLLLKFIVLKLPICLTIIIILIENSASNFISNFKWYGLLLMPIALFYIGRMFFGKSGDVSAYLSIKSIDYMTIGIIFVTITIAVSLDFLINDYSKIVNIVLSFIIFISWTTSLYTGTRSVLIVGIFFVLILISCGIFLYRRKNLKKTFVPVFIIIIVSIVSFSIWSPKYSGVAVRMSNFIYEDDNYKNELTINNSIDSVRGHELQNDYTFYIVNSEQPYAESIEDIKYDIKNKNEKIVDLKDDDNINDILKYNLKFNRITLWRFAFMEFQKKPIFGNGIAYCINKYNGFHPHCMIFEFLADIGAVGTVLMILLFFILLLKCVKIAKNDKGLVSMIILAISFIPIYLLSSGFFTNVNVIYTIFTLALIVLYNRNNAKGEKEDVKVIHSFFISYGDCRYDGRLRELIKSLGDIGTVSGVSRGGSLDDKIIKRHYIFEKQGKFSYLSFIRYAIKCAKIDTKINILLADNRKSLIPAYLIKILCNPDFVVQDMRELYLINESNTISAKLGCIVESLFLRCADLVICANPERARMVKKIFKCDVNILSYENIRKLEYANENNEVFKQKYLDCFNRDSFKIISTAGLDTNRLTDKLIFAVNNVQYPVDLYLVGGGTTEQYNSIKKIIEENEFENVHIIGLVEQSELKYLINMCDCGVVNYHRRDINNRLCASGKIFEFIFEGKPIIATNNITLKKFCKQYKVGIAMCNFEEAIETLIEDYEMYKCNAEYFSMTFDSERNNKKLAYQINEAYYKHMSEEV